MPRSTAKTKKAASKVRASRGKSVSQKKSKTAKAEKSAGRWSAGVMKESNAMDLKEGIFKQSSGLAIARSLKSSAEKSARRKSPPFRSAMSMLNFEINRAGKNLTTSRRRTLNQAKVQLRKLFGRAE